MKKIFTKLFLLTTLLMVSSELWAQDPLVMCLKSDKQTIKRTVSRKDLIYNLLGPGSTLYVYLKSDLAFTYSIYGYSEHDCEGDVTTIVALRTTTELKKSYDIEGKGYKSIKLMISPAGKDVELYDLEILAKYANIPNPYTFDDAGYNSANASKSFTMDYYGAPPTINYEYVTGTGYSGSEKFPISFAYNNGKMTMVLDGVRPEGAFWLPRLGYEMTLPATAEEFKYYGYGPYESYRDSYHHARRTWHESNAEAEYVPYIRPQEHGNHFGVKVLEIGDLRFEGDFECAVSHYSIEQVNNANHTNELERDGKIHLRVDYKMSGVGSGSCGPQLAEVYQLCEKEIHFEVSVMPR
jgi:hypothetical protein